jgi:hypothetical protein
MNLDLSVTPEEPVVKMKKGTRVSWMVTGPTGLDDMGSEQGHGITISDEEDGHILVAVDSDVLPVIPSPYHMVIYCAVTWLTVEP